MQPAAPSMQPAAQSMQPAAQSMQPAEPVFAMFSKMVYQRHALGDDRFGSTLIHQPKIFNSSGCVPVAVVCAYPIGVFVSNESDMCVQLCVCVCDSVCVCVCVCDSACVCVCVFFARNFKFTRGRCQSHQTARVPPPPPSGPK